MAEYEDRRTLLVVAGVFEIIMGFGTLSMMGLMVLGLALSPRGTPGLTWKQVVPALAVYGILGALFITLGIGSLRCRRWARALWLVIGWGWLAIGIFSVVSMAVMLPAMTVAMGDKASAGMRTLMTVVMILVAVFFYVLIPLTIVMIYRSPHVKATCEARDPKPGWTDRRPLPVLGLSLLMGLWGAGFLMAIAAYPVLPAFGTYLTGGRAMAAAAVLAVAFLLVARAAYRQQRVGWWGAAVLILGVMVSAMVTFTSVGMEEMYRLMEMPEEQIEMMKRMGGMDRFVSPWSMALFVVLYGGFLAWVRRYFVPAGATRS